MDMGKGSKEGDRMYRAIVRCPKCGNIQKYENIKARRRSDVFRKSTSCKLCGMSFVIKSVTHDRIIKPSWEDYEELKKKYTPYYNFKLGSEYV